MQSTLLHQKLSRSQQHFTKHTAMSQYIENAVQYIFTENSVTFPYKSPMIMPIKHSIAAGMSSEHKTTHQFQYNFSYTTFHIQDF